MSVGNTGSSEGRETYCGLDASRFIAAALVMVLHLTVATWAAPENIAAKIVSGRVEFRELFAYARYGYLGVEIFFVISGFVIARSAIGSTPYGFIKNRILRLYPAVWACALLTVAAHVSTGWIGVDGDPVGIIARSLTLWPNGEWVDGVYWTLGVEMSFYLLVWFALLTKLDVMKSVGVALGLAGAVYWIGGTITHPSFLIAHQWDRIYMCFFKYGMYFSMGMLFYDVSRTDRMGIAKIVALIALVAASLLEVRLEEWRKAVIDFHVAPQEGVAMLVFLGLLVATIVSMQWKASDAVSKTIRVVGMTTYPLYLLHNVIGATIERHLADAGLNKYAVLAIAMTAVVSTAIAVTVYVEPQVRKALSSLIISVERRAGFHIN